MGKLGEIIEATIIGRALAVGASDVHIEPRGSVVNVRLRIDGVLHGGDNFSSAVYGDVLTEIKSLAGLNVCETRMPQTGSFRITIDDKCYNFRVDILPTSNGEKTVLHLTQVDAKPPTLQQLGFWGDNLARVADILRLKRGLILLAGPDDTGKATTLFTLLSMLDNDQINISTIETSIEHKIPGANQIAVNSRAGLTFTAGLTSIAKSDSEIIMANLIPDSTSAKMLADTATSRLVFGSLSTSSGGEAINQLFQMSIEPYLVAGTLRNVISTRLIRKLCNNCRESYKPSKTEVDAIMTSFALTKPSLKTIGEYESQLAKEIGNRDKSSTKDGAITKLWRAKGCEKCLANGYSGRIGLYEILINSPTIERLIMGRADADTINRQSRRNSPVTLRIDGLVKALCGITTIEEVLAKTE